MSNYERLIIPKTLKAYVGGKFIRSESGCVYPVHSGTNINNVVNSSRKDARDAVRIGVSAGQAWADMSPYLRGQIMYRFGEMLESRTDIENAASAWNVTACVHEGADLAISYAGWCDKLKQVLGTVNSTHKYFSATEPRPLGLTGVWLGEDSTLTDIITAGLAALAAGNAIVQVVHGAPGAVASVLAEVIHVSDIPAGVWQILPTVRNEPIITLAGASSVRALDVTKHKDRTSLEAMQAETLGKLKPIGKTSTKTFEQLANMRWQLDYCTTWQPLSK